MNDGATGEVRSAAISWPLTAVHTTVCSKPAVQKKKILQQEKKKMKRTKKQMKTKQKKIRKFQIKKCIADIPCHEPGQKICI